MATGHISIVRAFHATTADRVQSILANGFAEPRSAYSDSRWLGQGAYFFQESQLLAEQWASKLSTLRGQPAVVLAAELDLTHCLDLLDASWHPVLKEAWERLREQCAADGRPVPDQAGFSVEGGRVKIRPFARENITQPELDMRPGVNRLDHEVFETAVKLLEQGGLTIESVRAIFVEGGEMYPHSWIFDEAHLAIAMRPPYHRIHLQRSPTITLR